MHPAPSIILFTAASGAGYGLMMHLGLLALIGALPEDPAFAASAALLAFVLVTIGLVSSTAHLGHPERAWRALSQWRTSWLSREGVMALVSYAVFAPFALLWAWQQHTGPALAPLALLLVAAAGLTVVCTGQIYASLEAIPAWHQPLTVPNYLLLALTSGGLWLDALLALNGHAQPAFTLALLLLVVLSAALKEAYWKAIDAAPEVSTPATATGLGHLGRVRMLEPPHTSPNYLLREMGFRLARRHARTLRRLTRLLAFALPAALLLLELYSDAAALALLAAVTASAGIVIERWLFFAEAKHVMATYYRTT